MSSQSRSIVVAAGIAAAVASYVTGCSLGQAKRELAGGATASDQQVLDSDAAPPKRVYVADFTVGEGAMKPASGLIAEAGREMEERPHLLGGGEGSGILSRRITSDTPTSGEVINTLAASITEGLTQQNLGFPVQRVPAGAPLPSSGWVITGQFVSVDPGNRAERAVIGFGEGAATTEVNVEVDRLGTDTETPVLRFGTQADSGKMPGAAVTMNPYVAAAKFVLGKNATRRDVQDMGKEIAKQIADYARARGVAKNP
jgi:uncharacterized protein DUF4410